MLSVFAYAAHQESGRVIIIVKELFAGGISVALGGVAIALQGYPLLVPPKDVNALGTKIREALSVSDKELEPYYAKVLERYAWDKVRKSYLEAY